MQDADRRVEERQRADLGGRDGEDAPDQDLLDVLAALRCSIDDEDGRRRGHGVDDADDRLLGHRRPARAARREQRGAAEREGERVPVGGLALDRVPGQERDRDAERRHLGERQIDEDHAARQHVQAEIDVDRGQDEAGEARRPQKLDHRNGPQRPPASASVSRRTLSSNSCK